jgi:hypothetical protein
MKIRIILFPLLIAGIFGISGCRSENKELKKDTKDIANVMCKSVEAMKNLKMADPDDSVQVEKLQLEYKKIQDEMTVLYRQFNTKYGEKVTTKEFSSEFRKYLNEAMLECKSLSKEDREAFEKGIK